MEKLYLKLEETKNRYELEKVRKAANAKEIFDNISFCDEVILREYMLDETTVNLFQRDIDLSKINEKYDILYQENNSDFSCIKKTFNYKDALLIATTIIEIISMYVLIPKNNTDVPFCLFVKRDAGKGINFTSYRKSGAVQLKCSPDLYCENSVYVGISEYDFEQKLNCNLQEKMLDSDIYHKINLPKDIYLDVVKEYVRQNYLNKEFLFENYSNSGFREYIKMPEKWKFNYFDQIISSILINNYERIKYEEEVVKITQTFDKYNFELEFENVLKKADVMIFESQRKFGKNFGFVNIDTKMIEVRVKIYNSSFFGSKLIKEKNILLKEGNSFRDTLSNYVINDFFVYI